MASNNSSNNIVANQEQQNDDGLEINENTREYCLNIFQRFIPRIQESINVKSDEVQRRINMMNQMWINGNLTLPVHKKLLKIAKGMLLINYIK